MSVGIRVRGDKDRIETDRQRVEFVFHGVEFVFSYAVHQDSELPEICVRAVDGHASAEAMLVLAFERGGVTLVGDSVHLAVDGDEAFCSN